MSLSLKVKRGYTAVNGVPFSNADLNAGFLPIITLEGKVGATDLDDGVIHKEHVTPDAYWYAVDSDAGANVLVATYDPAPDALEDGLLLACKVTTANAGAVTFNPNGLGAKPLLKYHDQALAAGDLEDNMIIEMRYDTDGDGGNGAWQLLTPVATAMDKNTSTTVKDNSGTGYTPPAVGGVTQIPHGLGKIPSFVRVVAFLKAGMGPHLGYADGDEVDIINLVADGTGTDQDWQVYTICADATNISIIDAGGYDYIRFCQKTGGGLGVQGFDTSKWAFKAYVLTT